VVDVLFCCCEVVEMIWIGEDEDVFDVFSFVDVVVDVVLVVVVFEEIDDEVEKLWLLV